MGGVVKKLVRGSLSPLKKGLEMVGIGGDGAAPPADSGVMPIPDQEEQRRIARKNAAKRRGGRSSTILTGGQDTLG